MPCSDPQAICFEFPVRLEGPLREEKKGTSQISKEMNSNPNLRYSDRGGQLSALLMVAAVTTLVFFACDQELLGGVKRRTGFGTNLLFSASGLSTSIPPLTLDYLEEEEPTPKGWGGLALAEGGSYMLIDKFRTLWTAGWNARYPTYYAEVSPAITWNAKAEEVFEEHYRRLHFPKHCSEAKGCVTRCRITGISARCHVSCYRKQYLRRHLPKQDEAF